MSNDIKSTAISWSVVQSPTVQSNEISTNTITLNSVDGSSNTTISSEGIITPNLTTFSINNNDLTFNDTEIVIGDKVLTFDGEDEVIPANSVTDEARVFARVAQESATVAEASMETAVASASAASISETNAANSATSAAESASTLEDIVDMAEWALPVDYMRFSHVKTIKELGEQASDLYDTEVWKYPLNSLQNDIVHTFDMYFPKLRKLYLQIDGGGKIGFDPASIIREHNLEEVRCYFPNKDRLERGFFYGYSQVDKMYIHAPKARLVEGYFISTAAPKWVWIHSATTKFERWCVNPDRLTTIAHLGGANIESIQMDRHYKLSEIGSSFPYATYINLQGTKLNKGTVLRIVNNLLTYDSTTMETVPTLTMGIDPALNGDEEINAALLLAQAPAEEGGKGWSVAVNGFTINSDANAATLGLRKPIYIKRWEDSEGGYIDENGTQWSIRYGNSVLHNWQANEQLGYEEFATLQDALETWGLTEYMEIPNEEQINNN